VVFSAPDVANPTWAQLETPATAVTLVTVQTSLVEVVVAVQATSAPMVALISMVDVAESSYFPFSQQMELIVLYTPFA
jgi:hypothetical protein